MRFLKTFLVLVVISSLAFIAGASPRGNNILRRIYDLTDEYIDPWADSSPAVIMSTDSNVISVPVSPTIIRSMESDVISVPVSPTIIHSTASDVIFVPVSPTSLSPTASHVVYFPVVSPTTRSTTSDGVSGLVSSTTNLPTASSVVFVPVSPTTLSTVSSVVSIPFKDQVSSVSSIDKKSSSAGLVPTPAKNQSSLKDATSSTATLISLPDRDKPSIDTKPISSSNSARDKDKDKISSAMITGSLLISVPDEDKHTSTPSISQKFNIQNTSGFMATGISDRKNCTSVLLAHKTSGGVILGSMATNVPNKDKINATAWSYDKTSRAIGSCFISDQASIAVTSSFLVIDVPDKDKYTSTASKSDSAVLSSSTATSVPEGYKPTSTISVPNSSIAVISSSMVIDTPNKDKDKDTTILTSHKTTSAAASTSTATVASEKYEFPLTSSSGNYDNLGSPSPASVLIDSDKSFSAASISTRGDKIDTYTPSNPASQTAPSKDENIYTYSTEVEVISSIATVTPLSRTKTETVIGSSAESTLLLLVPSTTSETLYYIPMPEVSKQRSVSPPNHGSRSRSMTPFLNTTSTVIPIWTPAMLGNAYGGGYVTTPSIFITSFPESPRPSPGIPPGYELSSEDFQSPKYVPTLVSISVQETTSIPEASTASVQPTKSDDKANTLIISATTAVSVTANSVSIDQTAREVPLKKVIFTSSNQVSKDKLETPGNTDSLVASGGIGFASPSFISKDNSEKPTSIALSSPGPVNDNSDKSISLIQSSAPKGKDEADETSYPPLFEVPTFSKVTLSTTTISKDERMNPTASSVLLSARVSITSLTSLSASGKGGNNTVILALSPTAIPEFQGLALKHTMGFTSALVGFSVLIFFFF